jgi:glutaminyl-peptide cyclotransferase
MDHGRVSDVPPEALSAAELAAGEEMLRCVSWQVTLGPRFPGAPGHADLVAELGRRLEAHAAAVVRQEFSVLLPRGEQVCTNLIGNFPGRSGARGGRAPAVLLGTHFDTRLQADRENDPALRRRPIPGANDGGSGTAVLLHLLPLLAERRHEGEVTVVFFDAEDVGDIAGNPFALGARRLVEQKPVPLPQAAVVLDMIGGHDLRLDLDAHILDHPPSLALTARLFALGAGLDARPFAAASAPGRKLRWIVSDQYPFLVAGVASCLLIDLDYPQWHTAQDGPEAVSGRSLATIAGVLRRYLLPGGR